MPRSIWYSIAWKFDLEKNMESRASQQVLARKTRFSSTEVSFAISILNEGIESFFRGATVTQNVLES